MPINFPTAPSVNDLYTFNGRTWKWNGEGWAAEPASYGPQGATGPQGAQGAQGPQGAAVTDASLLTSGTLAAARLPSGTILQVVQTTTTTTTDTGSSTFVATSCTGSITPSSTSNKVYVSVSIGGMYTNFTDNTVTLALYRGNTQIGDNVWAEHEIGSGGTGSWVPASFVYLDSPNTTSSTSYTVRIKRTGSSNVGVFGQQNMILMEVAG